MRENWMKLEQNMAKPTGMKIIWMGHRMLKEFYECQESKDGNDSYVAEDDEVKQNK